MNDCLCELLYVTPMKSKESVSSKENIMLFFSYFATNIYCMIENIEEFSNHCLYVLSLL